MNTINGRHDDLARCVDLLRGFAIARTSPAQALGALEGLKDSLTDVSVELAWNDEPLSSGAQFALYLTDDEGTCSLGYSPVDHLPWALRNTQRWGDRHVVRVDGELVDVDTVIAKLDFIWGDTGLMRRIVDDCIVRQHIARRGLSLSDDDGLRELNTFFERRGVVGQASIDAWMAARGLSLETIRQHVLTQALVEVLKSQVTEGSDRDYFESHRDAFERWSVIEWRSPDAALLARMADAASPDPVSVWLSAAAGNDTDDVVDITLRHAHRRNLETPSRPFVPRGEMWVRGPSLVGGQAEMAVLIKRRPACFDAPTAKACKDAVFTQWLEAQRARSAVEWFWGPASVD